MKWVSRRKEIPVKFLESKSETARSAFSENSQTAYHQLLSEREHLSPLLGPVLYSWLNILNITALKSLERLKANV